MYPSSYKIHSHWAYTIRLLYLPIYASRWVGTYTNHSCRGSLVVSPAHPHQRDWKELSKVPDIAVWYLWVIVGMRVTVWGLGVPYINKIILNCNTRVTRSSAVKGLKCASKRLRALDVFELIRICNTMFFFTVWENQLVRDQIRVHGLRTGVRGNYHESS